MRPIRLVYNDDGGKIHGNLRPGSVAADLRKCVDWIAETPIDVYVACVANPDVCYHATRIGEQYGMRPDQPLTDEVKRRRAIYAELAAEGTDFLRVQAEQARRRGKLFLAGVRMNDTHHNTRFAGAGNYPDHPGFSAFLHDHPGCRLDPAPNDGRGGTQKLLDYAKPQVREYLLAIIEEMVSDYPLDGLELDFLRTPHVMSPPITAQKVEILNDYVRDVRDLLDRCARQRGSDPAILGVRIPHAMEYCRHHGLDVETWTREALIDYLAPATFFTVDYGVRIDEFRPMVNGTGCQLLYSVQPFPASRWDPRREPFDRSFPMGAAELKALAANGHTQGCDGFHAFNLCCIIPEKLADVQETLACLAQPHKLLEGGRHYQYFPCDNLGIVKVDGQWHWQYFGRDEKGAVTWPSHRDELGIAADRAGEVRSVRFLLADGKWDQPCSARLVWRIFDASRADKWTFRLNGAELPADRIAGSYVPAEPDGLEAHVRFELPVDHEQLQWENELQATAVQLDRQNDRPRFLDAIEVFCEPTGRRGTSPAAAGTTPAARRVGPKAADRPGYGSTR